MRHGGQLAAPHPSLRPLFLSMPSFGDRRAAPRFDVVGFPGAQLDFTETTPVLNISATGALVISPREDPRPSSLPRVVVLAFAASLLAALVYLNALHNPFVYDDHRL